MAWKDKLKRYVYFPIDALFRYVYSSGQSVYPYVKFGKYLFGHTGHPVTSVFIGAAVAANVGTNSLVKVPARYREINGTPEVHPEQALNLQTSSGKFIKYLIKLSGVGMLGLEFIGGDFGTMVIITGVGELVSFNFNETLIRKIVMQLLSARGGLASARFFRAYEYTEVSIKNAPRLGNLYEEGQFLDKINQNPMAFGKAAAVTGFTMGIYVSVVWFWTKSALDEFSENTLTLDDTLKAFFCFMSVFFTTVFVFGWSPSMYDTFSGKSHVKTASLDGEWTLRTKAMAGLAAFCLPKDMLTWAVTTFMAIVDNSAELFKVDPYGPITALAAVCALTAGGFYGLSLWPGLQKTLAYSTKPREPLLLEGVADEKDIESQSTIALRRDSFSVARENSFWGVSRNSDSPEGDAASLYAPPSPRLVPGGDDVI